MSSCLPCSAPILPKFEQHILSLYPNKQLPAYKSSNYSTLEQYAAAQPDGYKPKNISDILKYSEMYPNKLPKIGLSLYNKTVKHINKNRPTLACIGLYTLLSLIEACNSDDIITLYDEHVLNIIQYVLVTKASVTTVQQKQIAFELIVQLMLIHENGTDYYKYDGLWAYIIRYLTLTTNNNNDTAKLRYSCIRACTALCMYFDTHRASIHYGAVIPLLLNNIHSSTSIVELNNIPIDPSWLDNTSIDTVTSVQPSPTELSTYTLWCYNTIIDTITLSDIESVLQPILLWLDNKQWQDNEISVQLLLTIANNKQLPYIDLVVLRLIRHIDYIKQLHNTAPTTTTTSNTNNNTVAKTQRSSSIEMQSVTTYTPGIKSNITVAVAQVVTDIIRRSSVKINNYQAVLDNILNSLVNTSEPQDTIDTTYIDKMCDTVFALVEQLHQAQSSLSILQSVLQRYHIHVTRISSSNDQSKLLQLATKLSLLPTCNLNTKVSNDKLITTIIIAALCSNNLLHRNSIYNILLNILLPLHDSSVATIDTLLSAIHSNRIPESSKHTYTMSTTDHTWLLSLVYYELTSSIATTTNTDTNDITCHITDTGKGETSADITQTVWRILLVLLLQSPTERLQQQYPMIQTVISVKDISQIQKQRIEVFVFAYATYVSLIYEQYNNNTAKKLDSALIEAYNQLKSDTTQQQCDVTLADKAGLIVRTHNNNTAPVSTYKMNDPALQLLAQLADTKESFEPSNFKYIIPELHNTIDLSISYAPSHILLQRSDSTVLDTVNDTNVVNNRIVADDTVEPISETQAGMEARGGLTQQPSTSILNILDETNDNTVQSDEPIRTVDQILKMNGTHDNSVNLRDVKLNDTTDLYDSSIDVELSNKLADMYNNRWKQYANKTIKSA